MAGRRRGNRQRRQNRALLRRPGGTRPVPVLPAPEEPVVAPPVVREPDAPAPASEPAPRADRADAAPRGGRRLLWGIAIGLFWVLVLAGAILAGISLWVRRTFGVVTVDQLLTNLPGGGGEGAGGTGLVVSAVVAGLVIPVAAVLVLLLLSEKSRRTLRRHGVLRGRRAWLLRATAMVLAVLVPLSGAAFLGSTIGAGDYVRSYVREATTGTTLEDYYVAPRHGADAEAHAGLGMRAGGSGGGAGGSGAASSETRRNLVLVYLESVEDALGDEEIFEKDMLAPVEEATRGWASIPSLQQYAGGGWTMAGIVGTQCGIPLRSPSAFADNTDLNTLGSEGHAIESYLPRATCLGDVLSREGYRNVFLGGADARFAGKDVFLEGHGYDRVDDLSEWRRLGETEVREDWGLSDRRLFARATEEVDRLHAGGSPFNLTLLTLDTHEPPHLYDYCEQDTEEVLTAITLCSMEQVAGFVDHLRERGYLDDTVVVLMGDHQKMIAEGDGSFDELAAREDRPIFNRVWSPDGATFARDEIDQLSAYPTLLELVGVPLADHRAGVGVSALAAREDVPPGTILDLSDEEYADIVRSRSAGFFRELWGRRPVPKEAG